MESNLVKVLDTAWGGFRQRIKDAYEKAFPIDSEREDFDYFMDRYINHFDIKDDYSVYVIWSDDGRVPGAAIVYDYFPETKTMVIEYVWAIIPNHGYAKQLVIKLVNTIKPEKVLVEIDVECPMYVRQFWDSLGFRAIQMKYAQPALTEDSNICYSLGLAVYGVDGDKISKDDVYDMLEMYFKHAFTMTDDSVRPYVIINRALNNDLK